MSGRIKESALLDCMTQDRGRFCKLEDYKVLLPWAGKTPACFGITSTYKTIIKAGIRRLKSPLEDAEHCVQQPGHGPQVDKVPVPAGPPVQGDVQGKVLGHVPGGGLKHS